MPTPPMRRCAAPAPVERTARPRAAMMRRAIACALVALLAACAHAPAQTLRLERPVVLLGEVHDNAAQHALRLQAFEAWLAGGARPALVMEQFDRQRQGVIDRLRAQMPPPDADALIAAAGASDWQWHFYRPFVALALQHGLPIVAANVSRDEARRVMREGLQATGFNAAVPPEVLQALAQDIEDSHCGILDTATARRMALAQVARDQAMAAAVEQHAQRGVLLLAGNGHVRTDVGVPRWLGPATRARSEAIGLLESDHPGHGRYDKVLLTATQERPDPCAAMRR
ncbi:MAG: ChaN family lipoprotein [Rubrivivax sp.]|nr:ChaN family lipoprotein [Rubrivivax sp.]